MVKIIHDPETGQPKRIKTGGRGKGAKNLLTRAMEQAKKDAVERLNRSMPSGFRALDLLRSIYAAEDLDLQLRMKAAELAVRYESPALQSIESSVKGEVGFYVAQPIAVAERDPIPGYTPPPTVTKSGEVLPPVAAKPALAKPVESTANPYGLVQRDPIGPITDVDVTADER